MSDGRRRRSKAKAEIEAPQAAVTVLGDRANLLILREAFRRTRRYHEFKERLGMSDAVLATRLRDLVTVGVLRTAQYLDHPPRFEYRLTERGLDFWSTAVGIWMWERKWGVRNCVRLPELTHLGCGNATTAAFGCGGCRRTNVSIDELAVDMDIALDQVRRAPLRRYRRASWKPPPSIDLYSEIDSLLGDRWTLGTLSAALIGLERFGEFQRALQISPPLLAQRLSDLVDRAVLERFAPPDGGAHHRYRLTQKGLDLMPVIVCNVAWATRWYARPEGPPLSIVHIACGAPFNPSWFCAECGERMDRTSMTFDIALAPTPSRV